MCGRFALTATTKDIEKLKPGFVSKFEIIPNSNIAPTQKIYAVLSKEPNIITEVRWGLIPKWATDITISNKMFNARAETLKEKPSFRTLVNRKRCLIIADCFYEWKYMAEYRKRMPYIIYTFGGNPFTFGGLWEEWVNPIDGKIITSATIITTQANDFISQIHERMPVIIEDYNRGDWLSTDLKFDDVAELTSPNISYELYADLLLKDLKNS